MQGQFLKSYKQNFLGIIYSNCTGTINIPDKGRYNFQYDEDNYKTFWKDKPDGQKWKKGKNFYNLRCTQNNDLSRLNNESNKVIKTSNQKYPNKYKKNCLCHSSFRSSKKEWESKLERSATVCSWEVTKS